MVSVYYFLLGMYFLDITSAIIQRESSNVILYIKQRTGTLNYSCYRYKYDMVVLRVRLRESMVKVRAVNSDQLLLIIIWSKIYIKLSK